MIRIGIINISDRASAGVYEDLPGKAARALLQKQVVSPWECVYKVVPDEIEVIKDTLIHMADCDGCSLILTTGGTGPAPRDVTPEATAAACEKLLPGFGELMRRHSLNFVPTAILSRQTAGIRGSCLIVNLPGRPNAIEECFPVLLPAIPSCISLIGGPRLEFHQTP